MRSGGFFLLAVAIAVVTLVVLWGGADSTGETSRHAETTESLDHEGRADHDGQPTAEAPARRLRMSPPELSTGDEAEVRLAEEQRKIEFLSGKLKELQDDERELTGLNGAEKGIETLRAHQARLRREIDAARERVAALEDERDSAEALRE